MQGAASDHFTPKGGPRLHVDDVGGVGRPMLFQHGLCGDANQTAEVFPANAALRRITLECRGHGTSEAGEFADFSIARFAQDAAELIEERQLAPLVIGGISMGAAIAMRLAVKRPDLVRGLVIARPAWATAPAPANMQPNAEVGSLLARLPREAARDAFAAGETAKRLSVEAPDNLASLMGFFSREPQAVTAALLQQISADGPSVSEQNLRSIAVPTLVIGNRMDSVHPLPLAQEIADLIPGAVFVEITSKAVNRARYVSDFQSALDTFLKGFPP